MSGNDDSTDAHHMAAKGGKNANADHRDLAKSALARAAPSPEVIAATEFLLAQPDAYLYRRRYLELVVRGRDSGVAVDYTAAERYLIATAAACRRSLRRSNTSPAEH